MSIEENPFYIPHLFSPDFFLGQGTQPSGVESAGKGFLEKLKPYISLAPQDFSNYVKNLKKEGEGKSGLERGLSFDGFNFVNGVSNNYHNQNYFAWLLAVNAELEHEIYRWCGVKWLLKKAPIEQLVIFLDLDDSTVDWGLLTGRDSWSPEELDVLFSSSVAGPYRKRYLASAVFYEGISQEFFNVLKKHGAQGGVQNMYIKQLALSRFPELANQGNLPMSVYENSLYLDRVWDSSPLKTDGIDFAQEYALVQIVNRFLSRFTETEREYIEWLANNDELNNLDADEIMENLMSSQLAFSVPVMLTKIIPHLTFHTNDIAANFNSSKALNKHRFWSQTSFGEVFYWVNILSPDVLFPALMKLYSEPTRFKKWFPYLRESFFGFSIEEFKTETWDAIFSDADILKNFSTLAMPQYDNSHKWVEISIRELFESMKHVNNDESWSVESLEFFLPYAGDRMDNSHLLKIGLKMNSEWSSLPDAWVVNMVKSLYTHQMQSTVL